METKEFKKEFIYKSTVLAREGWTEKAIKLFLPQHDKDVKNPVFKSASPAKLYGIERVELVEASQEFLEFTIKNKKRQESAQRVADTKKAATLHYVENLKIVIPDFTKEKLVEKAIQSFNSFRSQKAYEYDNYFEEATVDSDEHFLNRITTNYLRHKLTSYERELDKLFGKYGRQVAYYILKNRINNAIVEKYTWLKPLEDE